MKFECVDELPPGNASPRDRARVLAEFAAALRADPGHWYKYPLPLKPKSVSSSASWIRSGRYSSFTAGEFNAAVREGTLYVQAVVVDV